MSNSGREFERAVLEADSKTYFAFSIIFTISSTMFNSFDFIYVEYGEYAKYVKCVPPIIMLLLAVSSVFTVLTNGLRLEALKRVERETS